VKNLHKVDKVPTIAGKGGHEVVSMAKRGRDPLGDGLLNLLGKGSLFMFFTLTGRSLCELPLQLSM